MMRSYAVKFSSFILYLDANVPWMELFLSFSSVRTLLRSLPPIDQANLLSQTIEEAFFVHMCQSDFDKTLHRCSSSGKNPILTVHNEQILSLFDCFNFLL